MVHFKRHEQYAIRMMTADEALDNVFLRSRLWLHNNLTASRMSRCLDNTPLLRPAAIV